MITTHEDNVRSTDRASEALVLRSQLGDRDALHELVDLWNPSISRYIHGLTSNRSTAEDLAQETWVRAIRGLTRLRDPARFPGWLFTIARRTLADHLRQEYRRPEPSPLPDSLLSTSGDVGSLLEELEVTHLLESLEVIDRETFILHHLEGFSLREVAEIAGVPEGTVKSRLHRARQQLKSMIDLKGSP